MVDFRSSTFASGSSVWVMRLGNLPALLSPGPSSLGICLIRVSEQRKASRNFLRGTYFSLTVPEKRLSFWG